MADFLVVIAIGMFAVAAISRMVLGSVTDQVTRKATCPVLTVHPKRK